MKRLLILGLLLSLPALAWAAGSRTLSADISANGLNTLAITAGVGEVRITPSNDDRVHVSVKLEQKSREFLWFFHWQSNTTTREIQSAQLVQQRSGERLDLSLGSSSKLDTKQVKQHWMLQVPARLALALDMKVGQVTVQGVAGGVNVNLNVGEIDIDTPRGALNARVNVGQISATSASARLGPIDLSSDIGEAAVFRDGKAVRGGGRHSSLGRTIHLPGSGPDTMKLSVNVGEVDLRLNSPTAGTKP
ncbi:MAG: hypothetical protein KGL98_12085 [Gammaproteobacteria bacterium]|nr:hypothetical protein [Gammaproteobacteria bacterium]MDE2108422.1 hypothetical protein [Gammaproteobacteria bacterium]MDE2461963.1 hypothetical protein [Gammaproteobacteria bacterium]